MRWWRLIPGLVIAAYALFLVSTLARGEGHFQPDFRVYYYAVKAWQAGLDPYDPGSLSQAAGFPIDKTYVYPPLDLFVFRFISFLSYSDAYRLFLAVKCACVVGLLLLWRRILKLDGDLVFPVFCLLAFNGALWLDLRSGNVSLIEQAALWLAFCFFAGGSLVSFCLLVVLAASFKVTPLLFLVLLWSTDDRKKPLYFFGSLAGFVALHLAAFLADPSLFPTWLRNLRQLHEAGIVNPSTAAMLESLRAPVSRLTGFELTLSIRWALAGAIALAVAAVSVRSYARLCHRPPAERPWPAVFLACFLYALVLPRFKDYSYILLLAPAYSVIRRSPPGSARVALLLLAVLSAHHLSLPILEDLAGLVWDYYPLLLAYLFWWLHAREIAGGCELPARSG